MQVKLFAGLREIAGSKAVEIATTGKATVREVLHKLIKKHPRLEREIFAEDGSIQSQVNVLLGGRNVRWLDGLDTELDEDQELAIFPPIAGG